MLSTIHNNSQKGAKQTCQKETFENYGYLHIPGFFSQTECLQIREVYEQLIKNNSKPFYRIKSNSEEGNVYTSNGHVVNPFMNLHLDQDQSIAEAFIDFFGKEKITQQLKKLESRPLEMYKTMYFESNRGTERHFDSDIFGSEQRLIGIWAALEEITPANGAFFLYPFTHKLWNANYFSEDINEQFLQYRNLSALKKQNFKSEDRSSLISTYKKGNEILEDIIEGIESEKTTPPCQMGDVIIFDGNLLHGSFRPQNFDTTRHSISAHFITQ